MADTPKLMMRLEYYRSKISTPEKHKRVIKGLGFTRLNQIVEREDTPSVRGMVQDQSGVERGCNGKESFQFTGAQAGEHRQEACRSRYGLGYGQNLYPGS